MWSQVALCGRVFLVSLGCKSGNHAFRRIALCICGQESKPI